MKATTIEQNNTYKVIDGMGRSTDFYVSASNIKEACQEVKRIAIEEKKMFTNVLQSSEVL